MQGSAFSMDEYRKGLGIEETKLQREPDKGKTEGVPQSLKEQSLFTEDHPRLWRG